MEQAPNPSDGSIGCSAPAGSDGATFDSVAGS